MNIKNVVILRNRLKSRSMTGEKNRKDSTKNRRQSGAHYERAAGYYLEQLGCEVLEYNYRCRAGEIDLIARDGEYLVFCEVKYRANGGSGNPLEAVDGKKQRTIFKCAMHYMAEHHMRNVPCRFDVIGIEGTKVTYIKNAFTG